MEHGAALSPEQKKAKEIYKAEYFPAMIGFSVLLAAGSVVVTGLLRGFHVISSSMNLGGASSVLGFYFAHYWALRRVRRAGFSQEIKTSETIAKTVMQQRGEAMEWRYPKTKKAVLGFATLGILMGSVGLVDWPLSTGLLRHLGDIAFCATCYLSTLGILFLVWMPNLRIDSTGIVCVGQALWPRRLKWDDVASCEVKRYRTFSGERTLRLFIFRNGQGKKILELNPSQILIFSPTELDLIETEIKRRMTG